MFKNVMKLFYNRITFWILLAGTAIMLPVMFLSGRPLNTPETPRGILCLEFANSAQKVNNILSSWETRSTTERDIIVAAKVNTCLDFVFLLFYSLFLFTACRQLVAAMPGKKIFSLILHMASVFALIAGLLDIFENIGMLKSLDGHVSDQVAINTVTFATIKWLLVLAVILFIAGGSLYRYLVKRREAYN